MARRIVAEQNPDGTYYIRIFEPCLQEAKELNVRLWENAIITIPRGEVRINALSDNSNTVEEKEIFTLTIPECTDYMEVKL